MIRNRIIYMVLVVMLAGVAALSGAAVGGVVVYRTVSLNQPASVVAAPPAQQVIQASNSPAQAPLTLNTTDIQTTITQAVKLVGPAVVTVSGTIPSQMSQFGQSGAPVSYTHLTLPT